MEANSDPIIDAQTEKIEAALHRAEQAVGQGKGLAGTGFWPAVGAMRRKPGLAARFGKRASAIDRRAFEQSVRLKVPAWIGTTLLTAGTAFGIAMVVLAKMMDGRGRAVLSIAALFVGFGALELSTHALTHWLVGRFFGMEFTHYFIGGPPPPRPGVKIEYASYLNCSPAKRAVMHASGAVVTKLIPFALLPVVFAGHWPLWVVAVFVLVGIGQIVTDILFSTKTSDWKRAAREMRSRV